MPHPQPNDSGVRPSGCVGGCEAQKGKGLQVWDVLQLGAAGEPASKHPTELGVSSSWCHHLTMGSVCHHLTPSPTTGGGARPGGCAWWMSHNEWGDWRPGGERWTASDFWIPSTRNNKKVEEAGFRFCPPWGGAINSAVCMSVATQQRGADKGGVRGAASSRPACRRAKGAYPPCGLLVSSRRNATHLRRRCAPRHISIDIRRDVKQRSRDGNAAPQ